MVLPILALLLTSLVSSFAIFTYPVIEKVVYDTLIHTYDKDLLTMVIYVTFSLAVVSLLSTLFIEMLCAYIQISLVKAIREDVTGKVLSYPYGFFQRCDFGEVVERIIPEVDTIATVITTTVKYATYALQVILILFITLVLDYRLFILYLLMVGAHFLWHMRTKDFVGKSDRKVREREGILYSFFYNQIREIKEIKLFNLQDKRLLHLDEQQEQSRAAQVRSAFMTHLHSLGGYIPQIVALLVLALFFDAYQSGSLTIGFYFLFTGLLYLLEYPVGQVIELGATLERGRAAASRIDEINSEAVEESGTLELNRIQKGIQLEGVHFSYEGEPTLQGVDITLNPGDDVALVGASGSGKSTIAALLVRLFDVQHGRISIDGRSLKEYNLQSLRNRVGVLSQEPYLFNDTVREAVDPHGKHPDELIIKVLQAVKLPRFAEDLDRTVGENGLQVSMGEKQRIALARLMIRNCSVIIFDEATAHLDPATEAEILQTIDSIRSEHPDLITVTISHRAASVLNCKEILLLESGRVSHRGTPGELQTVALFQQLFEGSENEIDTE